MVKTLRGGLLVALVVVLAACSGGSSKQASSTTSSGCYTTPSAKAIADAPEWLLCLGQEMPPDTRADTVDGITFYVSDSARKVYAEDCSVTENAAGTGVAQAGGKYGPTPRNPDGSGGKSGYASISSRCDR